jgi:polyhydroxybutyrate depolymerase
MRNYRESGWRLQYQLILRLLSTASNEVNLVSRLSLSAAILFATLMSACSKEPVELGATTYGPDVTVGCATDTRVGSGGVHDDELSTDGIRFSVRTPVNYDPSIAHPLLLVYPAAGHDRYDSERFTQLTPIATTAGFIVAYVDHRRLSIKALDGLATIPTVVARKWCIDPERIFLTGHSDGGTTAAAMAFRRDDGLTPAAIVASAAGLRGSDLEAYVCPEPLPVMVLHNSDDKLFPGFGAQAARWWAECNQCDLGGSKIGTDGCVSYEGCAEQGQVRYCEGSGGHRKWPNQNDAVLRFFLSS